MPIPLFAAAAAWLAGLTVTEVAIGAVGAAAAYAFFSEEKKEKIKNKKIVILGDRAVGKTYLYSFLREGKLPKSSYKQTVLNTKELNLKVEKFTLDGADIPGGDNSGNYHDSWKSAMKEVDFILYLVDASKMLKKEEIRFETDSLLITRFLKENKGNDKYPDNLFIVGSHMDKISSTGKYDTYQDKFLAIKSVQELKKELNELGVENDVVLGSLNTNEAAEQLVNNIFGRLK